MKQIKYSKKIDKLLQSGVSLRSIRLQRRRVCKDKKGQLLRIKNIIIGFVSAVFSITIFFFASPFLKKIVSTTSDTLSNPLAVFVINVLPYIILLLVFLLLLFALRGDNY